MNAKKNHLQNIIKELLVLASVGILAGSASAFFLAALQWVTDFRTQHLVIIWFLPFGGLGIGLLYHYFGKEAGKGNNLVLEAYENPEKEIPLRMLPLVLFGTLVTHLLGGSAGREGTAVQMGSAIADRFTGIFKLDAVEKRLLLILGISAGFASVFGTPLAAAIFALEIVSFKKTGLKSMIASFLVAFVAFYTVAFWQIGHTAYAVAEIPKMGFKNFGWTLFCGLLFGWAAFLFAKTTHLSAKAFSFIKFPPLRPLLGGLIFVTIVYYLGTTKFTGLGIQTILESFLIQQNPTDFMLKILLTALTLGCGFKGGEVTPLFFVGATLGSALSVFVPLPVGLMAAMGFVAVFSGATHTPLACAVMGLELFGPACGLYVGTACLAAYFCSGTAGIYSAQQHQGPKIAFYQVFIRKNLKNL